MDGPIKNKETTTQRNAADYMIKDTDIRELDFPESRFYTKREITLFEWGLAQDRGAGIKEITNPTSQPISGLIQRVCRNIDHARALLSLFLIISDFGLFVTVGIWKVALV
ncbi:hypothetical protein TNCV_807811 [Trichonephila clavipes]|nr:hypothetical protein TNCV_807811 [Trichonephila clavipes]